MINKDESKGGCEKVSGLMNGDDSLLRGKVEMRAFCLVTLLPAFLCINQDSDRLG